MLSLTFGVRLRYFIARLLLVDIALLSRLHMLRTAMPFLVIILLLMAKTQFLSAQILTVSTLAGSGIAGFANGVGVAAQFSSPVGICSDGAGNLFVGDYVNNRIRQIVIATGVVNTLAGSGVASFADGIGTGAQFALPAGICSDGAGNLFVADDLNHRIRKIVIATGAVTTLAGNGVLGFVNGTGTAAQFADPTNICSDGAGNLFVGDFGNNCIRQIVIATGVVTTLAGSGVAGFANGIGAVAQFSGLTGICSDGAGNLFVADYFNNRIRKIVIATGVVTTFAGSGVSGFTNGTGATAQFANPYGICSDGVGNLFVSDFGNNRIRQIVIATGLVTTLAGSGVGGFANGTVTAAQFSGPTGIVSAGAGNLFVADFSNQRIRRIGPVNIGITSFSPTFGSAGASVVITGSGFTGATAVSFGGTPASSFVVNSDTQITAVVGSSTTVTGGQQLVIVTAPAGTFSLGGFSIGATAQSGGTAPAGTGSTAPPSAILSGFSPQSIGYSTPITLSGSGFTGATGLLIGGVPVTNFVVVNDNTITAIVSGVPVSDRVVLTGGLGASLDMSGLGLTYVRLPAPVIASVSSASLIASGDDAALTLSGFNFLAGARVLVREQNADATTAAAVPTSNINATQVAMTLPGVLRSPGTKIITLVNLDGQSGSIALTVVTGAAVQLSANDGQPFVFTTTASGRAFSVRLSGANIFRTAQAFIGTLQARVSVPSSTEAIVEVPASVNEFGGVSLTLRLQNSDGQSTTATVRIKRRPPPTILTVTLQSDGRLRVRGMNFMGGIRAALATSPLTILSQEGDTVFAAQIPNTFRLMANTPTVSLTVENPDGRSHGVLLPRSFFDGQIGSASAGSVVTPERTWENSNITTELVEIVAGKQVQTASQELSIYPNPMETELRIGGAGQRTVRVYDVRGGVVLEERTTSGAVNVAGLSAGAYTVVVESADGHVVRQRVVKR